MLYSFQSLLLLVLHQQGPTFECVLLTGWCLFLVSLTGRPPFVAETEEKLYELIKKGIVDFSDPCWETCHESGKINIYCDK